MVRISNPPKIVAELSGNHGGKIERAMSLIELAASSGADYVKLQTYQPDLITINSSAEGFVITDSKSAWYGRSLYDLYTEGTTPLEWHRDIFEFAKSLNMPIFSTPFDLKSVDFLEKLGCERYKIASFEITYKALITYVAQTGKPLIISTGMSTLEEISEALDWARNAGATDITLLKCTSSYPAPLSDLNLIAMTELGKAFQVKYGFSDHTLGFLAACAATALGATIIEKHITLDSHDGALDSAFSSDKKSFPEFVRAIRLTYEALGGEKFGVSESEQNSIRHRRSLYFRRNLKVGDLISDEDLLIVRPALGIAPKHFEDFVGRRLTRDAKENELVTWDHIR